MKGQWFIISAVVASSIFLGLSFLLNDYFLVDASVVARTNNNFYFESIENQFNNAVKNTVTISGCVNLTVALDELKYTAEKELAARGVFAKLDYSIVQCNPNPPTPSIVSFDFIAASNEQVVYNSTTNRDLPAEVIG